MSDKLVFYGVEYVEAEPQPPLGPTGEVCSQCAFGKPGMLANCHAAIDRTPAIFGGDCAERDVIYVAASNAAAPVEGGA